jgi:hypothetical protein
MVFWRVFGSVDGTGQDEVRRDESILSLIMFVLGTSRTESSREGNIRSRSRPDQAIPLPRRAPPSPFLVPRFFTHSGLQASSNQRSEWRGTWARHRRGRWSRYQLQHCREELVVTVVHGEVCQRCVLLWFPHRHGHNAVDAPHASGCRQQERQSRCHLQATWLLDRLAATLRAFNDRQHA